MAGSRLEPDHWPLGRKRKAPQNRDVPSRAPSDSRTAASDAAGSDSPDEDALSLDRISHEDGQSDRHDGVDIDFDRPVDPDDAGLGYGLDEAEEADRGLH
jgi:hypothetical protein